MRMDSEQMGRRLQRSSGRRQRLHQAACISSKCCQQIAFQGSICSFRDSAGSLGYVQEKKGQF